jgi:putative ABC transport system ATP-binding protein
VDALGLRGRLDDRPAALTAGQQQRVACARALMTRPAVVFADEPTGNLDSRASAELLGLLRASVDQMGQSVLMVTHDPTVAAYAHRVLFLADGQIVHDLTDPTTDRVLHALAHLASPTSAPTTGAVPATGAPPTTSTPPATGATPATGAPPTTGATPATGALPTARAPRRRRSTGPSSAV